MTRRALAVALIGAVAVASCSGPSTPIPAYPVYLLKSVQSQEAAWAAAARQDQPVLILGSGVYGLATECIPQRYYATADAARMLGGAQDGRLAGSAADGRLGGSASDARLGGSAGDGRLGGSAGDGRLGGSAGDGRLGGSAADGRLGGGATDGRMLGSGLQVRSFGATDIGRLYGAEVSTLTCRLGEDRATVFVMGVAKGMTGYLYSPRSKGRMDGVAPYN